MTRKRFVKLLMSMGVRRNTANAITRGIVEDNRKHTKYRPWLTWAYMAKEVVLNNYEIAYVVMNADRKCYEKFAPLNSEKTRKIANGEFYYNDDRRWKPWRHCGRSGNNDTE